jgi:hypothetical protein
MTGTDGGIIQTEDSDMKQNRILNYIGAAGLLLAVCACGKEDLNTTVDGDNGGAATALPEGTFVVDYSVSDGETSRAFEGGWDANQRISSLLYLLYDSEGQLVKEREIPDIDHETTWPLTRENMSWEQREALKDTLNSGSTYTAVFLANVKKDLFGNTQTEELLQNKENLTEAVLYLPQTPFTDCNMYYLWKEELEYTQLEGASDDSRDNPLSKNIILRRLVSRIDMVRETITDETEDKAVKAGMGINFDQLLVDGLNSALTNKIETMKEDGNLTHNSNCDNLLTLLKAKVGTKDGENTIARNNYDNYISQLVTNFKEIENYDLLVSPWTAFTTSKFTLESMHNRMSINDLTSSYDSNITSPTSYTYPVTNGKATWIGFASGNLSGIVLSDDDTSLTLTFNPMSISLGKNEKVSYTCNPIRNISYDVDYIGEDYTVNVNMSIYFTEYFSWDGLLTEENRFSLDDPNARDAFKNAIEGVFGEWNSDVSLSIKIPSSTEFTYTTTIE